MDISETRSVYLETLTANLPMGILMEDEKRIIVQVNQEFCTLFSIPVPPQTLIGTDCSNSAEQSKSMFTDEQQFVDRIATMITDRKPCLNELLFLKDGRIFKRSYIPVSLNGSSKGNVWIYEDVTRSEQDRKKTEETKNKYQTLFATMTEGVVEQDPTGTIIEANESASRILGLSHDQLFGKSSIDPHWRAMHEDGSSFPGDEHPAMQVLKTGEPVRDVVMGVHLPDDTLRWILINSNPIKDKATTLLAVTTFTDITSYVKAQNDFKESEERWKFAIESSRDGVWDYDPLTNKLFLSCRLRDILGLPENVDISYPDWDKGIVPDYLDELRRQRFFTDSESYKAQYRYVTPDKQERWLLERGKIVLKTPEGKPERIVGTVTDITEEVKQEQLKTDFISLVSHQLRTPLTSLRWAADEMDSLMEISKIRTLTNTFRNNILYMINLVNTLLYISRIESNRIVVQRTKVKLCDILSSTIRDISIKFPERREDIKFACPLTPVEIESDETLIRLMVENLISNAIKYSPEHSPVQITLQQEGSGARIAVDDEGYGIPVSERDHIFDRFYRASNVTEKHIEGSGLGLYLIKTILDLVHGSITMVEKQTGTRFEVKIS